MYWDLHSYSCRPRHRWCDWCSRDHHELLPRGNYWLKLG